MQTFAAARPLGCTCKLLLQIRHASKTALKSKFKGKYVPRPVAPNKVDRPPPPVTALPIASSSAIAQAQQPEDVEPAGVPERLEYEYKGEKLPDTRLVYSVGLALFLMCLSSADFLARPPRQLIIAEDDKQNDTWSAWKRYSFAAIILGAGGAIGAYAIYWPMRIVKRIDLIAPSGRLIPAKPIQRSGSPQNLATYHQTSVRLTTLASETIPRIFKQKTLPFANIRLLGPLSEAPKWYHPQSQAFASSKKRRGKFPPSIPFMLQDRERKERGYNLRRDDARFTDLEGLEQALLANQAEPKESPKAISRK